jgi:chemotaxis response regulator CheB
MTGTKKPRKVNAPVLDLPVDAPGAFPIVGIGASAGGLAAFEAFFKACHPIPMSCRIRESICRNGR